MKNNLIVFVIALAGLAIEVKAMPPSAPAFTAQEVKLGWLKKGKLVSYDPGRGNDMFRTNVVYFDSAGEAWSLTGSPWNAVQMIRGEMPSGVNASFIEKYALPVLTGFNACEAVIASSTDVDRVVEGLAYLEHDEVAKDRLRELLTLPEVTVGENRWRAIFVTVTLREGVRLKRLCGALKPFSLEEESAVTLTGSDSSHLNGDVLTRAARRKDAALQSWRDEAEKKEVRAKGVKLLLSHKDECSGKERQGGGRISSR